MPIEYAVDTTLDVNFTRVDEIPVHTIGKEVISDAGNTYIYARAGGTALALGAACIIDESGVAVAMTTTTAGSVPTRVGIPQVAVAANYYGWFIRKGKSFSVLAAASCVLDVALYTTATAGVVDDIGSTKINGLRLNATVGGAQALANASASTYLTVN